jgi:hypothetical protein
VAAVGGLSPAADGSVTIPGWAVTLAVFAGLIYAGYCVLTSRRFSGRVPWRRLGGCLLGGCLISAAFVGWYWYHDKAKILAGAAKGDLPLRDEMIYTVGGVALIAAAVLFVLVTLARRGRGPRYGRGLGRRRGGRARGGQDMQPPVFIPGGGGRPPFGPGGMPL